MTNEERRTGLNLARRRALEHAQATEQMDLSEGRAARQQHHREQAKMWSLVAQALKDGDPVHDAPDGRPVGGALNTEYGVIDR